MRLRAIAAVAACAGLAACASKPTKPLPIAKTVCITLVGLNDAEQRYVMPIAKARFAQDYGMAVVDQGCDLQLKYTRLGQVVESTGSFFTLGMTKKAQIGEDGLLVITPAGQPEQPAIPLSMRGNNTIADALYWVAQEIADKTAARYSSK